jgi:hypothetical protein
MSKENKQDFELRLLNAVRKTLISVAKDTMTKPGLRHPLAQDTQRMIRMITNQHHIATTLK